jgi:23S rRNA (pseudouridine1915-N3)-methyltransferase
MSLRVTIAAMGRLRDAPEAAITADYLRRFETTGRPVGLGPATLLEIDDRRAKDGGDAALLDAAGDAVKVALDERGKAIDSAAFAARLGGWRDEGARDVAFLIGGADGHGAALRGACDLLLSLGPMVWPHRLARVMLAEQLYRAASILAGGPYHRG